jgi:formamidopyrimidine-DNA glycosylase
MPELPEIVSRAREMEVLLGRTITGVEVLQPKALNLLPEEFATGLVGARLEGLSTRGKWIFCETTQGWLLLNLGMGGEILLVTRETLPEKWQLVIDLDDGSCLAIRFWWFGHVHYVAPGELGEHKMTAKLGPNALDLSLEEWRALLKGRRGRIKSFLLKQSNVAGIGNAYSHDILFLAGLHPMRAVNSLTEDEVEWLARAVQQGLQPALDKGGAWYELDLYGQPGGFVQQDIIIGYREGEPCPHCGTPIEKVKVGSSSSYVCPTCQPLEG